MTTSLEERYDRSLTKIGFLTVAFRKLSQAIHKHQGHFGEWKDCSLDPCFASQQTIDKKVEDMKIDDLKYLQEWGIRKKP